MENDILDSLEDLGYSGPICDEKALLDSVDGPEGGPRNSQYTQLVSWVTEELGGLAKLEEHVNATESGDHSEFLMELSSFLKELGCPYKELTEGPISQRLASRETRLLLLDFLLGELQAQRMITFAKPDDGLKVEMKESEHARDLKAMLIALGFPKPPNNITSQQLFAKVEQKLLDVKSKAHASLIGKPLFNGQLSNKQWTMLGQMQQEMHNEYRMRRQMMIKRLDVTVQSFQWSDRAKARENDLTLAFRNRRDQMKDEPCVSLGDLLAAREDLAVLEKTSSASVRKNTKSLLNKVIIGNVPDRGGRCTEHEPPPPEMPSWTQRTPGGGPAAGGRGGGGRGGGGNYGGDRVQGGWNSQGAGFSNPGGYEKRGGGGSYENRGGGGFNTHSGGYDNRGGGGYDNRGGGGGGGGSYDHRGGGGGYSRGGGYDNRGYDNRGQRGGRGAARGRY